MSGLPISRRQAFVGFSAAATAAGLTVPVFAEPAELDAALLAACADYRAAAQEEARLEALPHHPFGSREQAVLEERTLAAVAQISAALDTVAAIPAASALGMRVKAELIESTFPEAVDACELSLEDSEVRLVLSLAQDLLRLTGGAA
jgi:hypothetical protein